MKRNCLRSLIVVAFEVTHEHLFETNGTMSPPFCRLVSRPNAMEHSKRDYLAAKRMKWNFPKGITPVGRPLSLKPQLLQGLKKP